MDSPTALLLQDALDVLCSSHSSTTERTSALTSLEHFLATICVPKGSESTQEFEAFLTSQDAFECNIPSRILSWLSSATVDLELLLNKGSVDRDRELEAFTLASHIIQSLTIIQGVVLNHKPSKRFLGRKYALKILLDLFLVSRHITSAPLNLSRESSSSDLGNTKKKPSPPQLASALLDTLLCILVDSSVALRAFEEAKGVQVAVKILKRAGTPREVRMKCLEFLYFYLLDERSFAIPSATQRRTGSEYSLPATVPTTPTSPNTRMEQTFQSMSDTSESLLPAFNFTPRPKLSHVPGSFDSSIRSSHRSPGSSPRNNNNSNSNSTSSSFSAAFNTSSLSSSGSWSSIDEPRTPPRSRAPSSASSKLLMLRKELDFVPMSPKKSQIAGLGVGTPSVSRTPSGRSFKDTETPKVLSLRSEKENKVQLTINSHIKTTEEKKELLGSMLGNVDALVEGVKKAGIWGLG